MPRLCHLADGLFRYRWYAGILLFALLVLTGVHGFSIGEWDAIVRKPSAEYSFPSVGEHRRIRSDEWAVSLPFVRAQCLHPDFFPAIRHDLNGGRMDMLLFTPPNPVWDATVPGQAANWGYFLFGFARGLSWSWFLRYLIGFLFAFEFILIWLRGDRALALVAALSVVLGAPSIWWTTTIPYHQLFFFSTLVFLNRIFAWRHPAAVFRPPRVDDALLLVKPQGVGLYAKPLRCLGNAVSLHGAPSFPPVAGFKLCFKFKPRRPVCQRVFPGRRPPLYFYTNMPA